MKHPDLEELSPSYLESVRRFNARRRRELDAERYCYHAGVAESHARISEDYERRAEELCKEGDS